MFLVLSSENELRYDYKVHEHSKKYKITQEQLEKCYVICHSSAVQRGAGGGLAVIRALLAGSWAKCSKQDQGSTIDANFRMLNDCFKYCLPCSHSNPLNPLFWSYVGLCISFHPSSVGHLSVCSSQQVVVMPHMG